MNDPLDQSYILNIIFTSSFILKSGDLQLIYVSKYGVKPIITTGRVDQYLDLF